MITDSIEIINGDHEPPHPFIVVNRHGMHVDLSKVDGNLWDPTVSRIVWGHREIDGRYYGKVEFKNGTARAFFDPTLIER